ncbi:MAG TPA: MFS transporter [Gemmatimonadales bacterium]
MSALTSHDPYRALREPGFRRYLAGNLIGTLGFQMQGVAVGWELYERTHSALALGLVGLAQVAPLILFFLPAGHLVDRFDRRRVVMAALGGMALASAGLAMVSARQGPVPLVYGFLVLSGTARAVFGPGKSALLPEIVPVGSFQSAVAWNSGGWQMADVLGPAAGGALLALTRNPALIYLLHAALALVFVALLAGVRLQAPVRPVVAATLDSLLDGARFVWRSRILLSAITLDLFAVLFGGAVALLPVYAKDILHVGPAGLGWLLAAQSIGAVTTTLALAHRPPLKRAGPTLLRAVAIFGIATIVFGMSRSFILSLGALAVAGAADSVSVVIRMTLAQLGTPNALRGRVSAVNSLFIGTSNELGHFESGALAALVGPVTAVVAGGIGTLAVVAAVAARWPELRAMEEIEKSVSAEGSPAA